MTTQSIDARAQHDQLAARLEDRRSIIGFAQAFALSCVAFVTLGISLKLFRDSIRAPKLAFVLALVGLGCVAVAVFRLWRGSRLYRQELADFAELKSLRTRLGLDAPQLPHA